MAYAWRWLRSLVFIISIYIGMFFMALAFTPLAIVNRRYAFAAIHTWCNFVRWMARWMVGLRTEVRGEIPTGEVLLASKHQSFLDIILIVSVVPRPKFIMKKQIKWTPIVGYYAHRIGCIAVDRGKRGAAIRKMVTDVASGAALPGQLIIFPQGTRVAPGAHLPYKIGTAVLYSETGQACVPVAANVGLFWPRRGIYRKAGLAVIEFLPQIEQGLSSDAFMARLSTSVEQASDALMAEAGFSQK